jgi:hypothetical protein
MRSANLGAGAGVFQLFLLKEVEQRNTTSAQQYRPCHSRSGTAWNTWNKRTYEWLI